MNFVKNAGLQRRRLALAVGFALSLHSGIAGAMNLQQAYEAALQNDPIYRTHIHEAEAGRENRAIGRSTLLPQLSASYSTFKNRADQTAPNFLGISTTTHPAYTSRSGVVQLRQPLFSLDSLYRYKQGVAQANEADARLEFSNDDVALRTAGAYIDALYAQDQLALSIAQRDAYAEHMRVNERLYEKGEGTKTDLLEVQARLDASEAQVLEAKDAVVAARETLEGIVGQPIEHLERLAGDFRVTDREERSFDEWRSIALINNKDLKTGRMTVEVAEQDVKRNRSAHAPRLDFVGTYSDASSDTITQLNQQTVNRSIGIQLNVPIYSGGQINALTRQSVAGRERAKADLEARTSKVMVDLRKALSQVQSGGQKIDALIKAVDSNKLLIKATEQSIKGGVRINLDLLNAQQQLVTSQRDLQNARYSYLLAQLRLKSAAGTLDGSDIRAMNAFFR